jgi:hypothetical protein
VSADPHVRVLQEMAETQQTHRQEHPMTEDEFDGIAPADLPGIFLYGAHKLRLNDNGLIPGAHDPDDLKAVGALCVMINRLTEKGHTPFDGTICGLAVLAAALISADESRLSVPHLVDKWHTTLATASQLQLAGNE